MQSGFVSFRFAAERNLQFADSSADEVHQEQRREGDDCGAIYSFHQNSQGR
jgi:hypothetical protein